MNLFLICVLKFAVLLSPLFSFTQALHLSRDASGSAQNKAVFQSKLSPEKLNMALESLQIVSTSKAYMTSERDDLSSRSEDYVLVWSDEFDGAGAIDSENWFHQTIIPQGNSWFNNEVQHYTDRTANSVVENGTLKIIAKRETGYLQDGVTKDFTSARLNSKFAFTYGRIDVSAKLPPELGTWPAIWTLGQNISERGAYWQQEGFGTTPWPITGEIDLMEQFGTSNAGKAEIHGSTHTPRSNGATENTAKTPVPESTTDFHVYSVIWDENEIQFLVDDELYYIYNPTSKYGEKIIEPSNPEMNWPFDKPQYLILNIAMGGVLGGNIPATFQEAVMEIDYVRVYQESQLSFASETLDFIILDNVENGALVGNVDVTYVGNGILQYSFKEGNEDGTFEIDQRTGDITVADNTSLNFYLKSQYQLLLSVTDGIQSQDITVNISLLQGNPLNLLNDISSEFRVYPNPVKDVLHIQSSDQVLSGSVRVKDMAGRIQEVETIAIESGLLEMNFSELEEGLYIVQIQLDDGIHSMRIWKSE
ncbi:MAG: family 16 glycosylhydrolase [Ekhidna sp.]|nr:family 16 glycosylhydrolase [Ekhidna sp.]